VPPCTRQSCQCHSRGRPCAAWSDLIHGAPPRRHPENDRLLACASARVRVRACLAQSGTWRRCRSSCQACLRRRARDVCSWRSASRGSRSRSTASSARSGPSLARPRSVTCLQSPPSSVFPTTPFARAHPIRAGAACPTQSDHVAEGTGGARAGAPVRDRRGDCRGHGRHRAHHHPAA